MPTDRVHQERAGRNQSLFREVNERIKGLPDRPAAVYEVFICECYREGCTGGLNLMIEEYEGIRANPVRFAVLPGHVDWQVERVVESVDGRYEIVEKIERAAEVAAHLNPRDRDKLGSDDA
jgi:hypothetical protein